MAFPFPLFEFLIYNYVTLFIFGGFKKRILEKVPDAKEMFSFLKNFDGIPHNNSTLEAHAELIFEMVSTILVSNFGQVTCAP